MGLVSNGDRCPLYLRKRTLGSVCPLSANCALRLFEKFARRVISREYGLLDELFRIVSPELADLRIGLENGVGELAVHARDFADVDVENRRAVFVEPHRADRAMRQADIVHRLEEGRCVVGFAAGGLQRLLDDEKRRIGTCGIETGIVLVCLR